MTKEQSALLLCYYELLDALMCNSGKDNTQLLPACTWHLVGLIQEIFSQSVAMENIPNMKLCVIIYSHSSDAWKCLTREIVLFKELPSATFLVLISTELKELDSIHGAE